MHQCTVNPQNSGHIGDRPFVRYSEVGRSQRFWLSCVFEMTYEKRGLVCLQLIEYIASYIVRNATRELSYVRGYMDS